MTAFNVTGDAILESARKAAVKDMLTSGRKTRRTDRQAVSEALRLQKRPLWRVDLRSGPYLHLVTDYDELLLLRYGVTGQIVEATYLHYDEHGQLASKENIKTGKRKRVLHLINQANL